MSLAEYWSLHATPTQCRTSWLLTVSECTGLRKDLEMRQHFQIVLHLHWAKYTLTFNVVCQLFMSCFISTQSSPCWGIQMDECKDKGTSRRQQVTTDMLTYRHANWNKILDSTKELKAAFMLRTCLGLSTGLCRNLPKEKLVSFSNDGAWMRSEGRGISEHLRRNYKWHMFVQHCIVHMQVLVAKSGLEKLPGGVCTVLQMTR